MPLSRALPRRYDVQMMWRNIRTALAILLAVVTVLTSQQMAVARGQTRVGDQVVICSGYGITTAEVDENGNPVGPVHICPDMVLGIFAALDLPAPVLQRPEGRAEALTLRPTETAKGRTAPAARARDPPVVI